MPFQGSQATIYVKAGASPHTYDGTSELHIVDSETLRRTDELIDAEGIRGTRSHHAIRVARDRYNVGGGIVMRPGMFAIEKWIPRILGGATAGGVTQLTETIAAGQTFGVLCRRGADDFSYTDCKVNQAIFRAASGGVVALELDIMGKTEDDTVTPGAVPTLIVSNNRTPIVFSSGTLSLAGTSRTFEEFTLTINNNLVRQFYNSATAQSLSEQDLGVTLSVTLPWESGLKSALYNLGPGGTALGSLAFLAPTGQTITFDFGTLIAPTETPTIPGKTNVPFVLNFTAYETDASNKPIKVTVV